MNSIMWRTLHLPPHELNHREDTLPTTAWTQSRRGHFTYHHMNSIMGSTLHITPHELNHGEHTPPTTTWTQSWGGHSNDFFDLEAGFCFFHCFSSWPLGSSSDFRLYLAYDVVRWVPKHQVEPSFPNFELFCDEREGELEHSCCGIETNCWEAGGHIQQLAEVLVDVLLDSFNPG